VGSGRVGPAGALGHVRLEGVRCDLRFRAGRCRPPIRRRAVPAAGKGRGSSTVPSRLAVRDLTVSLVQADGRLAATYDGLELDVESYPDRYAFAFRRRAGESGEVLVLTGSYHPAGRVLELQSELAHRFTVDETAALFAAMGRRGLAAAQGQVRASGHFNGSLHRPDSADHSLRLEVSDLRLDALDGVVAERVHLALSAADGRGRVEAARVVCPAGVVSLPETPFRYQLPRPTQAGDRRALGTASAWLDVPALRGVIELRRSAHRSRFWRRVLRGLGGRGVVRFVGTARWAPGGRNPWLGSLRFAGRGLELQPFPDRPLKVSDIRWASAILTPSRLELTDLRAKTCGGQVNLQLAVDNWFRREKRSFQSSLAVAGLDVRALSAALGAAGEGKITGKLTGQLALSAGPPGGSAGDARLADRLVGRGRIFLDDGDLWSVPVVSWLFGRLGLERQRSALSDAHAVFTIRGPVLHIRRAVVANPLAGIECRKGTVNVRTHQVDAVVVAGTFVTANPLSRLLLGELRAKLMGRHVRGKWDELGAKDFVPLPAGKIAESSVKLFHQLARSGGDLSAEIGKTFDELFKRLKP